MKDAFSTEAIKATIALIGAALASMTLSQLVAILTAGYIVIQAAYLLRKWYREEVTWARKRRA